MRMLPNMTAGKKAMEDELVALSANETWTLVPLP